MAQDPSEPEYDPPDRLKTRTVEEELPAAVHEQSVDRGEPCRLDVRSGDFCVGEVRVTGRGSRGHWCQSALVHRSVTGSPDGDSSGVASQLRPSDLLNPASSGMPRRFRARLLQMEPRSTVHCVPWAVLTFMWSGRRLRGPLFPREWERSPALFLGDVYEVMGTVAFRHGTTVMRVLTIEESLVLGRSFASVPSDDVEQPQR
jgi:hypothetical protein